MSSELSELVDSPVERLHVEYKAWLDLNDIKARADLARHVAAISNYGGGYIVFGINDNGETCGPPPATFKLDHDLIASISKKYLDPAVPCDVISATSAHGIPHPIVIVPPHGATPICAKSNGPETAKGKIEGIVAGAYYLRKPGPESSQITASADWRDVIRRCALHDRSAILAAVTGALVNNADVGVAANPLQTLREWAEIADVEFLRRLGNKSFAVPLQDCRVQLSYLIETEAAEELPTQTFIDLLRQVGSDVDRHVVSGWSLFHVFNGEPLAPRWVSDQSAPTDEFVQCSLLEQQQTLGFDFWRISANGLATVIREFWEDTPDFGFGTREALNPKILLRMLGELVWHAASLSARFETPVRVHFRCEWRGLAGRQLFVPNAIPFRSRRAEANTVITELTWAAAALGPDVAEIVYRLSGKVARALDWNSFDVSTVVAEKLHWKKY